MSIKFWNKPVDPEVFIRFDSASHGDIAVHICDSRGRLVGGGAVINEHGNACPSVSRDLAEKVGIELDGAGAITRNSLAQICAEMAKRIQGV